MVTSVRQSDTCCYFLNLRLGAVIIGIINSVFFIFLFSWSVRIVHFQLPQLTLTTVTVGISVPMSFYNTIFPT